MKLGFVAQKVFESGPNPSGPHSTTLARLWAGHGRRRRAAFTWVELLIVIGVCAFVVIFLLQPFRRPRPRGIALGPQCMSNLKQLSLGYIMYAGDWTDHLPGNRRYTVAAPRFTNNWVAGFMDWSINTQNTNTSLLVQGQLAAYRINPAVFHCPGDTSSSSVGPRVRSYSMNAFVGDTGAGPALGGWRQFVKSSGFSRPDGIFVLADEHENSIDDGVFFNNPANSNLWIDLPASRHPDRACFSFADGHVETKRWTNRETRVVVVPKGPKPSVRVPAGSDTDIGWVLQRTSERTNAVATAPPRSGD